MPADYIRSDKMFILSSDKIKTTVLLGSRFTFAMFILSKDRLLSLFTVTDYLRMSMNESERPIQYPASLDVPIVFDPANSSLMNFIILLPPGATKKARCYLQRLFFSQLIIYIEKMYK